jgi:hypothetical protein
MTRDEPTGTGMPTRAIHESYLTLQQTHQHYRRVRERDGNERDARGELQDAVLTFYELLRPHLKHESALSNYWTGDLPDYTGWDFRSAAEARDYIQTHGTGVYQVQKHPTTVRVDQQIMADGGVSGWADWHELLGLSWQTERLVSVSKMPDDEREQLDGEATHYATVLRCAILPLRSLDRWQATLKKERDRGSGFMSGEAAVTTTREYQPQQKLITAKRLLVEAADRLGALSNFEASAQHTEITREDMEKVEEWRQKQIE